MCRKGPSQPQRYRERIYLYILLMFISLVSEQTRLFSWRTFRRHTFLQNLPLQRLDDTIPLSLRFAALKARSHQPCKARIWNRHLCLQWGDKEFLSYYRQNPPSSETANPELKTEMRLPLIPKPQSRMLEARDALVSIGHHWNLATEEQICPLKYYGITKQMEKTTDRYTWHDTHLL